MLVTVNIIEEHVLHNYISLSESQIIVATAVVPRLESFSHFSSLHSRNKKAQLDQPLGVSPLEPKFKVLLNLKLFNNNGLTDGSQCRFHLSSR